MRFADFNDLDSVKAQITDKTCAITMETIQVEVRHLSCSRRIFKRVYVLSADEHDMLLILDEIQCGMGRSGEMFAMAEIRCKTRCYDRCKGFGKWCSHRCILGMWEKLLLLWSPGDPPEPLYGGNPLVTAAADAVLDILKNVIL